MFFLAISVSTLLFVLILIVFYKQAEIADTKKKRLDAIKRRNRSKSNYYFSLGVN